MFSGARSFEYTAANVSLTATSILSPARSSIVAFFTYEIVELRTQSTHDVAYETVYKPMVMHESMSVVKPNLFDYTKY